MNDQVVDPGFWNALATQAPLVAIFLAYTIWCMRWMQDMAKAGRLQIDELHRDHARDIAALIEQSGKREERLTRAFERNYAIQARVLERLREQDPPEATP